MVRDIHSGIDKVIYQLKLFQSGFKSVNFFKFKVTNRPQRGLSYHLEVGLKPHQSQYWLNLPPDRQFDQKVKDICDCYLNAIERAERGEQTVSMDKMTGIQVKERKVADQPMRPGKWERQEARVHYT